MNDETLSNSDNPGAEATAGDAHTEELAQREDDVCAPPKAVAQEEAEPDTDTQAADAGRQLVETTRRRPRTAGKSLQRLSLP